jgi:hypothetical protein
MKRMLSAGMLSLISLSTALPAFSYDLGSYYDRGVNTKFTGGDKISFIRQNLAGSVKLKKAEEQYLIERMGLVCKFKGGMKFALVKLVETKKDLSQSQRAVALYSVGLARSNPNFCK